MEYKSKILKSGPTTYIKKDAYFPRESGDLMEFFRCEECKKLKLVSELVEVKVLNIMYPVSLCKECFKKVGGELDDSKSAIRTDEGSEGEDRKI